MFAGLRDRRGHQRALPRDPAGRRRRAVDRVRPADADGPRLRRSRERGRGRQVRRRRRHARRHGGPLRRHRPRRGHHVDDDQLAGRGDLRDVRRGRREDRRRTRRASAARCRTTSSRSTRRRRSSCSRRARRCGSSRDTIAFCAAEMPRWHPVSISGYHIREAGSTAAQELAFTLANGFAYVELALERGLDVDEFAPRLSFFFNAHIDFFEEIAKYRAARRIWARWMRERYGAHGRRVAAAAVPHADRGRVAHRAAARGQHRPHRDRGARRRARRHAEAAHQLDGRGARAADGEGGAHRAAHPAGHRPRDRRRRTSPTRSAARGTSRR